VARTHTVSRPAGRDLHVAEDGDADGFPVLFHHGTPAGAEPFVPDWVEAANERGVRLIAYDRPGYGGSTPHPSRSVADAAADVATILDALGIERFATYGWSGGGPHALACAALLPERCSAAATIAGVAPFDASDLEWLAGMGEENVVEFGTAREGRGPLTEYCLAQVGALMAAAPEELADAMRPHLSEVDRTALTGELAEFLTDALQSGLRPGVEGWVDDDLAFVRAWGFDLDAIAVPLHVWQGEHDLMVPPEHARWLQQNLPGADGGILPDDGHLTLFADRIGDIHAWLLNQAMRTHPA
jgi:pimeloyl-ACP methyl ester carboxylesterase